MILTNYLCCISAALDDDFVMRLERPGTLTVNGRVEFGQILAGFQMTGLNVKDDANVTSNIGSIIIGGYAMGTVGGADQFGFVAEHVGTVKIGGLPLTLTAGYSNDDFLVGVTGDLKVREII